jgi:hypothetical protein
MAGSGGGLHLSNRSWRYDMSAAIAGTRLAVLALTLAFAVVPAAAADGGPLTITNWVTMSAADQATVVLGSMDMLAVLGLACPEDVAVRDVMDSLRARLSGGEIKAAATLSGTILGTSLGKGCRFSQGGLILRVLADHASSDEQ